MTEKLILPEGYSPVLNLTQTQRGIKVIKDTFELVLGANLNLERVSAPLFVRPESGLNDDLNGVERPVSFDIKDLGADVQIVHSLAKWKRFILSRYGYRIGQGIYTDMNAIRRDEELDNLHSVYVDQWDWEKVIRAEDRNVDYLKQTVRNIVSALHVTQGADISRDP
ncbi:MAG: aspartate--ammonia ligase, partial [Clostridia bacterium]|nr:aspartate--ammonia ligase [Clostridia bacterium]